MRSRSQIHAQLRGAALSHARSKVYLKPAGAQPRKPAHIAGPRNLT
jgi:hypothetical protein